jgi:hypothetical protein
LAAGWSHIQFDPNPAETWEKMLFRLVPIAVTAVTITRKMQAAINAYSIAVAPLDFEQGDRQFPLQPSARLTIPST